MHIHVSVSTHFVIVVAIIIYAIGIFFNGLMWSESNLMRVHELFQSLIWKVDWYVWRFDFEGLVKFFAKLITTIATFAVAVFWLPIWIVLFGIDITYYRIQRRRRQRRRETQKREATEEAGGLSST